MPKFVSIQANQSYLFGLDADGEVWQMVDDKYEVSGGTLVVYNRRRVWKKVTDLIFENGEWR